MTFGGAAPEPGGGVAALWRRVVRPPVTSWSVHSSGRFDRPESLVRKSVHRLRNLPGKYRVTVVTGTEANGWSPAKTRRILGGSGNWAYAHFNGRGVGDTWATWDDRVWRSVRRPYTVQITHMTWTRSAAYGGKRAPYVRALVVPLRLRRRGWRRTRYYVVVHMPLENTPLRREVWLDCARSLVELGKEIQRQDPYAELVFVGDWNRDYREPGDRMLMSQEIAAPLRLRQAWAHHVPRTGGTIGRRKLIDGHIAPAGSIVDGGLVEDDASSDHRPMRTLLKSRVDPARRRRAIKRKKWGKA